MAKNNTIAKIALLIGIVATLATLSVLAGSFVVRAGRTEDQCAENTEDIETLEKGLGDIQVEQREIKTDVKWIKRALGGTDPP